MSDKLLPGVSVPITFAAGEAPSPEKLTAITAQLSRASSKLEKAVGDIHSQSWPYSSATDTTLSTAWGRNANSGNILSGASDRDLDIANLARLVGPASILNPKTIQAETEITEDTPVAQNAFPLKYPVSGVISATNPTFSDLSLSNFVATASAIQAAGDYSVSDDGKVHCYTATQGGTATYTTNPNQYRGGMAYSGARFNVIPDPNQIGNGAGCAIGAVDGQGRYPVTLPTITQQQSDVDSTSISLDDDDINFERQLLLPLVLTSNFVSGDQIPDGFLFLKNETTNEVYEDGVYYYDSDDSILVGNVDLDDAVAAGNDFSIITVGTNITNSIDDLRNKHLHTHDRSMGESFVDISGIVGQYNEATSKGAYTESDLPGNFFSQYLHRDGYTSGTDDNMNDHNCLRGSLMLGSVNGTPGAYVSQAGQSYSILFGGTGSNFPSIYRDADEDLYITGGSTGGSVYIDSATSVSGLFVAQGGIIGNTLGTLGLFSPGISPYGYELTFVCPITNTPTVIDLPANIEAQKWFKVEIMVEPDGDNNWYEPNDHPSVGAVEDWQYYIVVSDDGTTSQLNIVLTGGDWLSVNGNDIPFKVLIWYQDR